MVRDEYVLYTYLYIYLNSFPVTHLTGVTVMPTLLIVIESVTGPFFGDCQQLERIYSCEPGLVPVLWILNGRGTTGTHFRILYHVPLSPNLFSGYPCYHGSRYV